MTEYYLTDVSYTFHYTITVEVMNRLHNTNNSNTQIYYIHNQLISKPSTLYGIIGLIAGVLILIVLVIIVVLLIIILVLKRRKVNKTGYSKQMLTNNEEDITPDINKQYINLSNLEDSPNSKPAVIHSITKKPGYEKLTQTETPVTSPLISPPVDKDGYTMLDQLEVSLEPMASDKGDDIGLEDNELHQYENFGETLYQSTYNKYADNPHAILVPPNKYKNHLNSLLSNYRMEKEYRMLGGQDLRYDCSHALLPINKNKNKYKQIYPYDKSRVVLETAVESDYINAATIPGFHLSDTFIATQAPKTNTETDFWEMILEQRVCTIVMLTRVVEMGKEKSTTYWPKVVGSSSTFNNIEVTLHREDMYPSYIVRKLGIRGQDNRNYMITQFHYVTWPDHDVPQLYMNLLEFTQKVKQHRKKERTHLVVHCSAGVGRTGTFIALYNLIEGVNLEAPISVYRVVNEMREYRPQMVQTFNQYKFIYLAILELIFGTTSIPNGDYCETYKLYQQSHGDITDIFKEQFQELNYQTDHSFCYPQTAGHDPSNEDKNVVKDILPYDTNRVILYSPSWPCEYINASYIDSYELVATLFPTENTIQDYLQLVYQLEEPVVVLLFTQDEYQKVRSGMSNRVNYWLEESGRKDFDGFSVITEKSQNSSFLIQQKMKVLSSHENDEHSFTQFISPTWEETGRVTDVVGVLTLLELISKQQQNTPGRKLIICCSDGIGKSGVLLTVYNTIRGMQENSCIDVFQMVKQLRNSRRNMVPTLEHYLSCYHLINEYCQMNI
ncbi:Protein tyrosine phosphatase e [Oopsacas minuta]|uniref:protein-tyrosine-phosphatase n=1 Tax=Oopsacas minuta TaxID=111878 RepID=A0AAV7JKW7_9METZ|nr:Protein tyrosine phosphatase e [Oopsacas minuta]